MLLQFLHTILRLFSQSPKSHPPQRKPKLGLEFLENRVVPAMVWNVDDDLMQIPNPDFQTIQEAIDAASVGDEIRVFAGTYTERLSLIGPSKNGIQLMAQGTGQGPHANVIVLDTGSSSFGSIIDINGAEQVRIEGFTINGAGNVNNSLDSGIRVIGGGSADIRFNHITNLNNGMGMPAGFGIRVGGPTNQDVGSASIQNNIIDNYQKGGIIVENLGSSATVLRNTVTGIGTGMGNEVIQNGIEFTDRATGVIANNTVNNNTFSGGGISATGILLSSPDVDGDGFGDLSRSPINVMVQGNTAENNTVGIALDTVTGVFLASNFAVRNDEDGILLLDSPNNRIQRNWGIENGFSGITLFSSDSNLIFGNFTLTNVLDGIFLDDSSSNTIQNNRTFQNMGDGLRLENGSNNNLIFGNGSVMNDGFGLTIFDSNNNTVIRNSFFNNGLGDIQEDPPFTNTII